MNSDELLEIDVATFAISRRVRIGKGHTMAGPAVKTGDPAPHHGPPSASPARAAQLLAKECAGTFVSVSPDDRTLYVACNYGNTLQVWDAPSLTLIKEIPVGAGAYNVEPSLDGSVVIVTNKKDQSVSLIDGRALTEVARLTTTKKIVHGIAYSPDGRYAYVSQESIGSDPGAVDVLDLTTRKITGTIGVPAQPTGITVIRTP
jgi:DNA-binding beta-propeller fold protein YncE